MSTASELPGALRRGLERPTRGVVGLVDDLLALCQEHGLQLEWQDGRCCIRSGSNGSEDVIESPLRKSEFRAVLARVAALCNERRPGSVSPYGGKGDLSVVTDGAATVRVSFANTTDEQGFKV